MAAECTIILCAFWFGNTCPHYSWRYSDDKRLQKTAITRLNLPLVILHAACHSSRTDEILTHARNLISDEKQSVFVSESLISIFSHSCLFNTYKAVWLLEKTNPYYSCPHFTCESMCNHIINHYCIFTHNQSSFSVSADTSKIKNGNGGIPLSLSIDHNSNLTTIQPFVNMHQIEYI